jgi:hypothetical protein
MILPPFWIWNLQISFHEIVDVIDLTGLELPNPKPFVTFSDACRLSIKTMIGLERGRRGSWTVVTVNLVECNMAAAMKRRRVCMNVCSVRLATHEKYICSFDKQNALVNKPSPCMSRTSVACWDEQFRTDPNLSTVDLLVDALTRIAQKSTVTVIFADTLLPAPIRPIFRVIGKQI